MAASSTGAERERERENTIEHGTEDGRDMEDQAGEGEGRGAEGGLREVEEPRPSTPIPPPTLRDRKI